jgi:hypothetical protein
MNAAVPDSLVTNYRKLIPSIVLPDENDRHVVAAAIRAKANAIVTYNLKDFPAEELEKYDLEAIHPDDFINYQIDLDTAKVIMAAKNCCGRLKKPPRTGAEYLEALERVALLKTASALREYVTLISPMGQDVSAEIIPIKRAARRNPTT